MVTDNFFRNIVIDSEAEIFDTLFKNAAVTIERITSFGQSTPAGEWYDQDTAEWVMMLEGSAGIMYENDDTIYMMNPGDYILIAPHRKHRVEFTDQYRRTLWLAVHFVDN